MSKRKKNKPTESAAERALRALAERLEDPEDQERWLAHYIMNPRQPSSLNTMRAGKPHPYRGLNSLILSLTASTTQDGETPFTDYWLTYRQAKKRGGYVRRGESGTLVIVARPIARRDKDAEQQGETGSAGKKSQNDKSGKGGEGAEVNLREIGRPSVFFTTATVFNTAQTEGCDLSDIEELLALAKHRFDHSGAERDGVDEAIALCRNMPNPPEYREKLGIIPHYLPLFDTVETLPEDQFDSPAAYAKTMLHEYAHSTGHHKRLGRPGFDIFEPVSPCERAAEEMTAETAALMLAARSGLRIPDMTDNSARYVRSWARALADQDGRKQFAVSAAAAQRIVDYMTGPQTGALGERSEPEATQEEARAA